MQTISSAALRSRIDANESVNLLDVREPAEHAAYHIGGILLPLGQIMLMQTDEIDAMKNEEIICYCRSGSRSMQACLMLETAGFINVKNLVGGMLEWEEKYK
ncbi:MAG: rhodanese-like domain-containing protein [Ferruginibacter sp.]|nr:rhodanese-like domain-containing protein [Ferruginibacter sp.]